MNLFITCWVLENNQQNNKKKNIKITKEKKTNAKERKTKMLPIIFSILFI